MEKVVASPRNFKDLAEHNKKPINAKQILLDLVNNHLIPHISEQKINKDVCDALGVGTPIPKCECI